MIGEVPKATVKIKSDKFECGYVIMNEEDCDESMDLYEEPSPDTPAPASKSKKG